MYNSIKGLVVCVLMSLCVNLHIGCMYACVWVAPVHTSMYAFSFVLYASLAKEVNPIPRWFPMFDSLRKSQHSASYWCHMLRGDLFDPAAITFPLANTLENDTPPISAAHILRALTEILTLFFSRVMHLGLIFCHSLRDMPALQTN